MNNKIIIESVYSLDEAALKALRKKYFKAESDAVFFGSSALVLRPDGTVVYKGKDEKIEKLASGWQNVIKLAAGVDHAAVLFPDGTVTAVGDNKKGQCDVNEWKNVVSLFAGGNCTIGITESGDVLMAGTTERPVQIVSEKKDSDEKIIKISAGSGFSVMLRANGNVTATGDNLYGECNVRDWKNIASVCTGARHTVGLRKDGTVVAVGSNTHGQIKVGMWSDIKKICAGYLHPV